MSEPSPRADVPRGRPGAAGGRPVFAQRAAAGRGNGYARAAAVVTWIYVAAFGLATIPVGIYLMQRYTLPTFFGIFQMYGGLWSAAVQNSTFLLLLGAFLLLTLAVGGAGWMLWKGSRAGAIVSLALLPVEAVFWVGFSLPIPWMAAAARVVLIALAWRTLR